MSVFDREKGSMFWPGLPPTLAPGITQADKWVACKTTRGPLFDSKTRIPHIIDTCELKPHVSLDWHRQQLFVKFRLCGNRMNKDFLLNLLGQGIVLQT